MDITIVALLARITSVSLPLSVLLLTGGIIADILKKRFHWSKFALIFFVVTILLLMIQIKLTYLITGNILNK